VDSRVLVTKSMGLRPHTRVRSRMSRCVDLVVSSFCISTRSCTGLPSTIRRAGSSFLHQDRGGGHFRKTKRMPPPSAAKTALRVSSRRSSPCYAGACSSKGLAVCALPSSSRQPHNSLRRDSSSTYSWPNTHTPTRATVVCMYSAFLSTGFVTVLAVRVVTSPL
jgi:hypothetical protein